MAKKTSSDDSDKLFIDPSGQRQLFGKSLQQQIEDNRAFEVKCLGMMFRNEEERRTHFREKLREKLADPEFRTLEGFPEGCDEDILSLSDPPYYTACPNPFIPELLATFKRSNPKKDHIVEPFCADVSEGRNDEVYTAHTYHTKVPPRAIARYVLHYTSPGDVVLDLFAGAGMTGVGCMMCQDRKLATDVDGVPGVRYPLLCDLSPVATLIGSVYLSPPDPSQFDFRSKEMLDAVEAEVGDLWTLKVEGRTQRIEFQIWTEVFSCPQCQQPVISERVVDATEDIGTAKEFPCPSCGALVSKAPSAGTNSSRLERRLLKRFDKALSASVEYLPRWPLFAQVSDARGGRVKVPMSRADAERLTQLPLDSPHWFPTDPLIDGERSRVKDCCYAYGITHLHQFYLPRQLRTYSAMWHHANVCSDINCRNPLRFFVQSNGLGMTVMNRYGPTHYSQVNKYFSGTLYIPSVVAESSHVYSYTHKRKRLIKAFERLQGYGQVPHAITTQSATDLQQIPSESVDYVFTDPPFGRNLQYSELNQVWEGWLRIHTNRGPEAVMDTTRNREVHEYTSLMKQAFAEAYRVLRAGRWITVVFHNSSNAVWMAIQESLFGAGFVVADVRTLSKERGTYKQIRQGVVKQDLVITAYRPSEVLEKRARLTSGEEESAWAFVQEHLRQLPVFIAANGTAEIIDERQNFLLFDRMVAFHVQRGVGVPTSAAQFYTGLEQRFSERDGMFFLPEQVAEYDKKRMTADRIEQLTLFVSDERSAIQWLRRQLKEKPQSFQEVHPAFMREIAGWEKFEETLELLALLEENFVVYDGKGDVPSQIHSYLSSNFKDLRGVPKSNAQLREKAKDRWYVPDPGKQADLEKIRERTLLADFEQYKASKQRNLKVFRTEAVRAGFKAAYDRQEYKTIVEVARRLPENVLQEDEKLLMYYDVATMRLGDEDKDKLFK